MQYINNIIKKIISILKRQFLISNYWATLGHCQKHKIRHVNEISKFLSWPIFLHYLDALYL